VIDDSLVVDGVVQRLPEKLVVEIGFLVIEVDVLYKLGGILPDGHIGVFFSRAGIWSMSTPSAMSMSPLSSAILWSEDSRMKRMITFFSLGLGPQ